MVIKNPIDSFHFLAMIYPINRGFISHFIHTRKVYFEYSFSVSTPFSLLVLVCACVGGSNVSYDIFSLGYDLKISCLACEVVY